MNRLPLIVVLCVFWGCVERPPQPIDTPAADPHAVTFSAGDSPGNSDWLSISEDVFSAIGDSRKVDRNAPREAGLWTKQIPNSKQAVAVLLDYAKSNRLEFVANSQPVGWLEVDFQKIRRYPDSMDVFFRYSLFDSKPVDGRKVIQFKSPRQAALFNGKTVDIGTAVISLGSVIPAVTMDNGAAVIRWEVAPTVQLGERGLFGLLRRITTTRIKSVRISPEYGEFETTGIVGWALPRLEWE